MQRELVPIGDALSGMGGPVKAIREASPQALHHFTRFDQVNQLVSASEADPDLGFMARTMALCSLPRSRLNVPTNRITEILNGRRAITGDTALRLAHFFGTSEEFWLNLQKLYELRLAEKKASKTIKALPTLKNEHAHA